mmetsp:Transcript_3426/g.6004  ORF Transcript_3426/g.6004 Transcript_3426/m.6004 type:complete len:91 (-) Transcript_3426:464-736(-)
MKNSGNNSDILVVHFRSNHKVLLALADPNLRDKIERFREGKEEFDSQWLLSEDIFEDRLGQHASKALLESVFGTTKRTAMLKEMVLHGEI